MLETITHKNNIQDINLEPVVRYQDLYFEEGMIDPKLWEALDSKFSEKDSGGNEKIYFKNRAALVLLGMHHKLPSDKDVVWQKAKALLDIHSFAQREAVDIPAWGAIIWPERIDEIRKIIDERIFTQLSTSSNTKNNLMQKKSMLDDYIRIASGLKIIDANKFSNKPFDMDLWYKAVENLSIDLNVQPERYAATSSRLRMLMPEKFGRLGIGKREWEIMLQRFSALGVRKRWDSYINMAGDMKILAADSIKFDTNGLLIINSSSETNLMPSALNIPERRRF